MATSPRARARTRLLAALAALLLLPIVVSSALPAAQAAASRLPLADAKMVNYYPSSPGWTSMWTSFDPVEFDRDMGRIAYLGGNAVRLIVQPSAFGYPAPSAQMTDRLASAIAIADSHGVAVELTLFDWFSSYVDVNGSKAWAAAVLKPYADDARVFAVELQNELPIENVAAVSWASTMLPYLQTITTAPTTVSVNGTPARLASLKTLLAGVHPTFWSYHYYDQALGVGAASAFALAKGIAAPEPLYIGETGVDTLPRPGEDAASAEDRQDHFYRAVFTAAAARGLPAPAPWTLWDFTSTAIPGRTTPGQYSFGMLRTDGTAKPAAVTTSNAFHGLPIDTGFNGSFERGTATMPAQWTRYLPDQATVAVDSTVAHSGTHSVRFSQTLGDASGWPSVWTPPVQVLQPGRAYTATVSAKGSNVTGTNRLGLTWYDADGHYLGVSPSASVALGTSDWRQLTATGIAPLNAASVLVQLQSTRNTGTVWFDDVTFG